MGANNERDLTWKLPLAPTGRSLQTPDQGNPRGGVRPVSPEGRPKVWSSDRRFGPSGVRMASTCGGPASTPRVRLTPRNSIGAAGNGLEYWQATWTLAPAASSSSGSHPTTRTTPRSSAVMSRSTSQPSSLRPLRVLMSSHSTFAAAIACSETSMSRRGPVISPTRAVGQIPHLHVRGLGCVLRAPQRHHRGPISAAAIDCSSPVRSSLRVCTMRTICSACASASPQYSSSRPSAWA